MGRRGGSVATLDGARILRTVGIWRDGYCAEKERALAHVNRFHLSACAKDPPPSFLEYIRGDMDNFYDFVNAILTRGILLCRGVGARFLSD